MDPLAVSDSLYLVGHKGQGKNKKKKRKKQEIEKAWTNSLICDLIHASSIHPKL